MSASPIYEPLALPNGSMLKNRLCKAAMEENLSVQPGQYPGEKLFNLYRQWADGGAGLILSGNVMVDPSALTGPGAVVLQKGTDLAPFRKWAEIGKSGGGQFWLQISHPGRQLYKNMGEVAVSPSGVALDMGGLSKMFAPVRALKESEIEAIIRRFADTAEAAQEAGFDGVEIHGAHGYLISQFLSPMVNQRDDGWGGDLEGRARFLLEIIDAVRKRVKLSFGVGLKLNSADFQRGGFDFDDARQVVEWLNGHGLDFIELSGGSYESAAMMGHADDESGGSKSSTLQREAYFVDFAKAMQAEVSVPLMVTGGFRTRAAMEQALQMGAADMIGLGRPLCMMTDAPAQLIQGLEELPRFENSLGLIPDWLGFLKRLQMMKAVDGFAGMYWFYQQLWLLGHKGQTDPNLSVFKAFRILESRNKAIMQARNAA